jgi:hypothetical protein
VEPDLHHVAIGVGAGITVAVTLIAPAAILGTGRQNGHDGE